MKGSTEAEVKEQQQEQPLTDEAEAGVLLAKDAAPSNPEAAPAASADAADADGAEPDAEPAADDGEVDAASDTAVAAEQSADAQKIPKADADADVAAAATDAAAESVTTTATATTPAESAVAAEGTGGRPPVRIDRKRFDNQGSQSPVAGGSNGKHYQQRLNNNWRDNSYGGGDGNYGKMQQPQPQQYNRQQQQYGSNGYGGQSSAGGRYARASQQPSGSVYGYPPPLAYQNGQSAAAASAYYHQQQQHQQGRGPQQQQQISNQGAPAATAAAAASGDPQSDMLILQQQSYVPQDQIGGGDRGVHPGLAPHAGHVGPSPGRSQYHPSVPPKAILYGSYVDPNMIQPGGSSRNTSPGNGENDRKSNTNLYIRGLLPSDTDETIRQLVSENANIPNDAINSTKAVLDEQTGQCKGYGFVDFRDETQAQLALEALTKTSLRNGKLQISYARESEKDPTNIYIKNLPIRTECNEEWMSRIFTDELSAILTGRIISCRVMRATDPNTRQQTSATGAGFIRFEKDQDAVNAIAHINKSGPALGQKYGCPRPLEAKLADKTNQRKKQRAQQQQQPGLATHHHGLGPSPPSAGHQLQLGLFQQNQAALAAAARSGVLPGNYNASLLPGGAAQLYNPAAVQSTALSNYTSRVTPAAQPSAPAHTSYVFQASPASAMSGGGGGPSIYQHQRNSWIIDPSSYAAAAAAGMSGMYAPQLLAAAPQTSMYAQDAGQLYYTAAAGLDPTANAYHPMGLTSADQQ